MKQPRTFLLFFFTASFTDIAAVLLGWPVVNQVAGSDIHATARWEGKSLRVESRARLGAQDMTLSERWTLARDGRTLTNTRTLTFPMGGGDQVLVFVRK